MPVRISAMESHSSLLNSLIDLKSMAPDLAIAHAREILTLPPQTDGRNPHGSSVDSIQMDELEKDQTSKNQLEEEEESFVRASSLRELENLT